MGRKTKGTLLELNPKLVAEWHPNLNSDLTPRDVSYGSNKKVWWQCKKGHEWQAAVFSRNRGNGCPYCCGQYPIIGETDLATVNSELAREWHPNLNGDLTPQDIMAGSGKKIWWLCSKGHEWQAAVYSRNYGCGCPYCCGQYPIIGETDLATVKPELVIEWHPVLNGKLTPQDVTVGSDKRVWWLCSKGHEWRAPVNKRSLGSRCPYCLGKYPIIGETDLATINPKLAKEWHPILNGKLLPQDVTSHSSKSIWWLCKNGHEWKRTVNSRRDGKGCPYCSGRYAIKGKTDLATINPELAKEWHSYKNGELTPQDVTACSQKKVWWECANGHEWKVAVHCRNRGNGCPYCSGTFSVQGENDLFTVNPVLAGEWHPILNGKLTPRDVSYSSHKKVWWICENNHEWKAVVYARTSGRNCPYCSRRRKVKYISYKGIGI